MHLEFLINSKDPRFGRPRALLSTPAHSGIHSGIRNDNDIGRYAWYACSCQKMPSLQSEGSLFLSLTYHTGIMRVAGSNLCLIVTEKSLACLNC